MMIRSPYKQWQSLNTANHNFIQNYNKLFEVSALICNAEYFESTAFTISFYHLLTAFLYLMLKSQYKVRS